MTALCMLPPAMVLVIILCCLCVPQGHRSVLTLQKEVITENSSVLNATKFVAIYCLVSYRQCLTLKQCLSFILACNHKALCYVSEVNLQMKTQFAKFSAGKERNSYISSG